MNYTVKADDRKEYDNCNKYELVLYEDGEERVRQWVTFSNWQLNDGKFENRLKQWADRRTPETVEREDVKVEVSV